ncbi:MAG: TIGR04053 family radical SAM/SPASM domain-containing protein [Bryobacterales bacterium]|nr:TIGR04053 family radical SAM/SPASM domain-containing protein [Bryobacterales bacterium]
MHGTHEQGHGSGPRHGARDYTQTPLNIYWEMTQACALACRHCRAEAMPEPHPMELTTAEGKALLQQIPQFGDPMPHLILTGGDPLARKDLWEVIDEARRLGIGISITPAATPALTRDVLVRLKDHGVEGLGLSLDGSSAERHDAIRGVPGTFDRTMQAMRWAQELEIPLQVNTLVAAQTADDAPAIFELLKPLGVARWSLFFLISVGRGKVLEALPPEEGEKLMEWIYQTSLDSPFIVATTEAPSYRRVAMQLKRATGADAEEMKRSGATRGFGIRDGHGIMFVSNTGEICPAGFLPVPAGNIRNDGLVSVYRDSPLFRQLHDPNQFEGRCGVCEYHKLCGGSRARAYSATGNPLESDPLCSYEPLVPITRDR